jgi:GNAT superfamily N-acetyltransferase
VRRDKFNCCTDVRAVSQLADGSTTSVLTKRQGGLNAGKLLLQAAIRAAKNLGATILMLHVAARAEFAHKVFESHGFRLTMQEICST